MNYLGAGRREVVSEKVASINCHLSDYQLLGGGMCGVWGGRSCGGGRRAVLEKVAALICHTCRNELPGGGGLAGNERPQRKRERIRVGGEG